MREIHEECCWRTSTSGTGLATAPPTAMAAIAAVKSLNCILKIDWADGRGVMRRLFVGLRGLGSFVCVVDRLSGGCCVDDEEEVKGLHTHLYMFH